MKRSTLQREGQKWVDENIITEEQFEKLLAKYPSRDPYVLLLIFAILLTGIGLLIFIFSDWASELRFFRLLIVGITMAILYGVGNYFYRTRSKTLGISFITLGYIVFGAGLFLGLNIYNVDVHTPWPYIVLSIVGLILYFIFEHRFLFIIAIAVTTIGQIYSAISHSMFCWILFLILLFGFGHFVYHRAKSLYTYAFGISFLIQMAVLTSVEDLSYYWLIVFYLVLYLLSEIIPKEVLRAPLRYMSLLGIFAFNIYQAIILSEEWYNKDITLEVGFILAWVVLFALVILLKVRKNAVYTYIDLVLFLPVVYIMSTSSILTLILLFGFSLAWLFIGYNSEANEQIVLGTIAFLLSTFTAYIQFAWESMNRSLFFLIGGALLFTLSFLLESRRRKIIDQKEEGN